MLNYLVKIAIASNRPISQGNENVRVRRTQLQHQHNNMDTNNNRNNNNNTLPPHVRTWLCMEIDVQPTPLEIKAILTVVPVAVYLVKGPVGKNWAKSFVVGQNRIRKLQN